MVRMRTSRIYCEVLSGAASRDVFDSRSFVKRNRGASLSSEVNVAVSIDHILRVMHSEVKERHDKTT